MIPEKVVRFLPGVPHHTGQVESAAQLHVNLSPSHDLGSGLWQKTGVEIFKNNTPKLPPKYQ